MKFVKLLHEGLVALFILINGMMLHLFLLHFPYGLEPFFISLVNWNKLSPQIGYVVTITLMVMVVVVALVWRLGTEWKNRILYMRMNYPHPAFNAFLTNRRQPFETSALVQAFPKVKDSGFNPQVQIETWNALHKQHADMPVVMNTRIHWHILRDLYLLALVFLGVFLVGWVVNFRVPFQIVSAYLFLFGAQFLFLLLMARKVGYRLVDNVLGVALGMDDSKQKDKKR
ncbi:hypothetical protein [Solemya velesiana gill symbiont]|nr:hypothetical protein [Solemya velesiana gill symbiont]